MDTYNQNSTANSLEWLASCYNQVDWPIPAYLTFGFLHRTAQKINSETNLDKKIQIAENEFSVVYNADYLAAMYLDRYSKIKYICQFKAQIDQGIKSYFSGYFYSAILTLIPVIEGTVRLIAGTDLGQGTARVKEQFGVYLDKEIKSSACYYERVSMLNALKLFMEEKFLINTEKYSALNKLNRHGILHGTFLDYGEKVNFLRLLTVLDLICFVITLQGEHISMFAPEPSTDSVLLADKYNVLNTLNNCIL